MADPRIARIAAGRTDLVFEHLAHGGRADATDHTGVSLIRWCVYYGDVSAVRHLLAHDEPLSALGPNLDLNGAAFHGHWRLCEFLLEQGADVAVPLPDTHETPLHAALCAPDSAAHERVVEVLLAHGAPADAVTRVDVPTGAFMREARTRGETPLHRAAAFGTPGAIELLLSHGGDVRAVDAHGDTPLAWASWHARPTTVLRLLLHDGQRIHPDHQPMPHALLGRPLR